MAAPSDNYSIVWVRYDRKEGGCVTHALADDQARTMCGLAEPASGFEGGFETLTTVEGMLMPALPQSANCSGRSSV